MSQYVAQFLMLKDADRQRVIAAAKWGDGPFTRMVLKKYFPKIESGEIPALINHCRTFTV